MSELEKIIRPIVEGQIRGFLKEHPGLLKCVDWYKPRQDKEPTFIGSLSKRIVRDLCCEHTVRRIAAALESQPDQPQVPGTITGNGDGLGVVLSQPNVSGIVPGDHD